MDKIPATSGCSKASIYDKGINLGLRVITSGAFSDKDIESTLAMDMSRFKDTNLITTSSDPVVPIGNRPIAFEATVFWSEIKMQDNAVAGYVASYFITETCGIFDYGSRIPGFSTHVLSLSTPLSQPQRDKLLDLLEKEIYDQILKTVKARRETANK
jgi:hypothetical protein